MKGLQNDILNAQGKVALLEVGDWGNTGESKVDLETRRFGAEPPSGLVQLVTIASRKFIQPWALMRPCGWEARRRR